MAFYYTALYLDDVWEFAEHYESRAVRDDRVKQLEGESMGRGSVNGRWLVYSGDEPIECARVRALTPFKEGEDKDEYEARLAVALKHAFDSSTSVLTPPPVDDSWPFERCPVCRHRIGPQVWMPDEKADCPACGWVKPLEIPE